MNLLNRGNVLELLRGVENFKYLSRSIVSSEMLFNRLKFLNHREYSAVGNETFL